MDTQRAPSASLHYASGSQGPPIFWSYRIALVCGGAPLLVGLSILATFLVTRANGLPIAGVLTIAAGGILFLVGMIALVFYGAAEKALRGRRNETARWRILGAIVLLLANFPAAIFCVWAAAPYVTSGSFK